MTRLRSLKASVAAALATRSLPKTKWAFGILLSLAAGFSVWKDLGVGTRNAIDLGVYRSAGHAVIRGTALYGPKFLTGLHPHLNFTYPPFAALLFVIVALLPTPIVAYLWDGLMVFCLWATVAIVLRRSDIGATNYCGTVVAVCAVALATRPVHDNLSFGQIDLLIMFLCVADACVVSRSWQRGILTGVAAAVKLTPCLFILMMLPRKEWRKFITACVSFLVASSAGFLWEPTASTQFFLHLMWQPSRTGHISYFSNQSLLAIISRATNASGWALLITCCIATILAAALWAALISSRSPTVTRVVAIGLATVVISPISWVHEMVWLIPAILLFGLAQGPARGWRLLGLAGAFAILITGLPYLAARDPNMWGQTLADSYGLIALGLLTTWMATTIIGAHRRIAVLRQIQSPPPSCRFVRIQPSRTLWRVRDRKAQRMSEEMGAGPAFSCRECVGEGELARQCEASAPADCPV
ncbi:MAG: glycosyltransferase 87 family protein [Mycobacteriales bacterium]